MESKRRTSNMLIPTIIMGVIAITLFIIAYQKGQGEHITGMKSALNMIIQISPLLFFALIIAGAHKSFKNL